MTSLVDSDWLAKNIGSPNVRLVEIDWDGTNNYNDGHIPGAIGWFWKDALWDPLERQFPTKEEFSKRLGAAGIARDTTVVFYGTPVQYGTYAWWVFKLCGHPDVRVLDGGKVKWALEGREITTEQPKISPTTYPLSEADGKLRASRADVLENIGTQHCTFLDHRSFEEYSGQMGAPPGKPEDGAERNGRIPGANHVPFDSLLNEDTTFKTASEIQEIVGAHVSNPQVPIISYCRLSHRATLGCFALTELLPYTDVRVYDGSWTEWGSMVGVPIER